MGVKLLDKYIPDNYLVKEWKHACAVLQLIYQSELHSLLEPEIMAVSINEIS